MNFVSLESQCFPRRSRGKYWDSRETKFTGIGILGKQNSLFPSGPVIKCLILLLHNLMFYSRFFLPVLKFTHAHASIMLPPRHPCVLARVIRWQLAKPINPGGSCSVWNGLIRVNKPKLVVSKLFPRKRGQRKKITLSRGLGKDFEYINISIKCDSQGWLVGKNQNGRYETQNTRAKINFLFIF